MTDDEKTGTLAIAFNLLAQSIELLDNQTTQIKPNQKSLRRNIYLKNTRDFLELHRVFIDDLSKSEAM